MSSSSSLSIITNVGHFVHPDADMPIAPVSKTASSWQELDRDFKGVYGDYSVATEDQHIIPEFTPISDQGRAGSCVANAWCDALEILMGVSLGEKKVVQLSRRFSYWTARYLHSATHKDNGTYLRAAAHQLRKIGVIPEAMMPYSDRIGAIVGSEASPLLEHYTQASNNRLSNFYRVSRARDKLLREAEIAIRTDHPVIIGVPVTRQFQRTRSLETFEAPTTDITGLHAMIVTGVSTNGMRRRWFVRNSWGEGWGEDGHCWITDDYLALSQDTWVGTYIPNFVWETEETEGV